MQHQESKRNGGNESGSRNQSGSRTGSGRKQDDGRIFEVIYSRFTFCFMSFLFNI